MIRELRLRSVAQGAVSDWADAAVAPEVAHALAAWVKAQPLGDHNGVLVGGLALAFYAKPRYTEDIDLLFLTDSNVPDEVPQFVKHRKGAFQDKRTHVEVEVLLPSTVQLPIAVARKVVATAKVRNGLKVASAEGLIAMKLFSAAASPKRYKRDMADVEAILEGNTNLTLAGWPIPNDLLSELESSRRTVLS